jgi:H+/Cl- antiporter ClcA
LDLHHQQNLSSATTSSILTNGSASSQAQQLPRESALPRLLSFKRASTQIPSLSQFLNRQSPSQTSLACYSPPFKASVNARTRGKDHETIGYGTIMQSENICHDQLLLLPTRNFEVSDHNGFFTSQPSEPSTREKKDEVDDLVLSASPGANWTRTGSGVASRSHAPRSVSFQDDTLRSYLQRRLWQQQESERQSIACLAALPPPPRAPTGSHTSQDRSPALRWKPDESKKTSPDSCAETTLSHREKGASNHDNPSCEPTALLQSEDVKETTDDTRSSERLSDFWSLWLLDGVKWDDDGMPHFEDDLETCIPNLPAWFRFLVFNPIYPEFTAVQQSCWAVVIGITMGIFTALWQHLIGHCVELVWKTVPELLLRCGILTDLNGNFPLPYYMVLCPAVCGCVLSYVNVKLPTTAPSQNDWIRDTHNQGVIDSSPFWHLFFLSTAGMASGMCLGPELPLVLLGGMYGSWLGLLTKQSILQARVMNLTAASAMVSGFFGFPMAGGLFVLELPHRMGLQYFEALSPATVASITAVIANRMVTGNDVKGYYHYPFLTLSLPSRIFVSAIVYGAFGSLVGLLYCKGVRNMKLAVHGLFHSHQFDGGSHAGSEIGEDDQASSANEEASPLVSRRPIEEFLKSNGSQFTVTHEPTRAALVGTIAGLLVGTTGLFLPHVMFWGEAQLQTLIDKGRTPLPIFGRGDEPTAKMTAYGFCLVDPSDPQAVAAGFSLGCSVLIALGKIWATGVSLGTGLPAGQFWGPLFTGCAAGHFFTGMATQAQKFLGFGGWLSAHPCVAILCVMGSSHVVTYRAFSAIALILTLTITSFDSEHVITDGSSSKATAGDYSAVFPLLVVAVYVSFILARDYVFYDAQCGRGDILALPEVLCEPRKVGRPLVVNYRDDSTVDDSDDQPQSGTHLSRSSGSWTPTSSWAAQLLEETDMDVYERASDGIDHNAFFNEAAVTNPHHHLGLSKKRLHLRSQSAPTVDVWHEETQQSKGLDAFVSFNPKTPSPMSDQTRKHPEGYTTALDRKRTPSPQGRSLVQVKSFGVVVDHQPSLLDQARVRSATLTLATETRMQHNQNRGNPSLHRVSLSSSSHSSSETCREK